jgi:hypothetical protein
MSNRFDSTALKIQMPYHAITVKREPHDLPPRRERGKTPVLQKVLRFFGSIDFVIRGKGVNKDTADAFFREVKSTVFGVSLNIFGLGGAHFESHKSSPFPDRPEPSTGGLFLAKKPSVIMKSLCRILRHISLATLLIPFSAEAAPLFGAELEVPEKHMTPWVQFIDYGQLKVTFFEKVDQGKVPLKSTISEGITINPGFAPTKRRFEAVFRDLPLSSSHFFDSIPDELRAELTEGMTPPAGVVITRGSPLPEPQKKLILVDRAGVPNPSLTISSRIDLSQGSQVKSKIQGLLGPDGKPLFDGPQSIVTAKEQQDEKIKSMGQLVDYQTFWQTVTARWNSKPLLERMEAFDWRELGATQKAKLLLGHYEIFSRKDYGPSQGEEFVQDPLDLKWTDQRAEELFSKFYVTPDGMISLMNGGIAEFHTLNPEQMDPFMAELKSLLQFHQVERRVLKPQPDERQEFGLHVHISAPVLSTMTDSEVSQLKILLALRGMAVGDVSVLLDPNRIETNQGMLSAQDYSVEAAIDKKDILRRVTDDRIEVRYFVDDIESELREYDRLFKMPKERLLQEVGRKIQTLRSRQLFRMTVKLKPEVLHFLFPFETWDQLQLTREDRELAIKTLRPLRLAQTYKIKGGMQASPQLSEVLIRQITSQVTSFGGSSTDMGLIWIAEIESYQKMVSMGMLPKEDPSHIMRNFQISVMKNFVVRSILEGNSLLPNILLRSKNEIFSQALIDATLDRRVQQKIDPIFISQIKNIPPIGIDTKTRDIFAYGLTKANQPLICLKAQRRSF